MNLRAYLVVGAALASLAAAASANASITFVSYGTALPSGETTITDFATLAGATGTAGLFTGSQSDVSAAPAFSAGAFDTASYLSVQGGESETLSFKPMREVSVYVGSLDSYNTVAFGGPGGATYTGGQLSASSTAIDDGNQTAGASNGRFIFDFSAPVTSVTLSSQTNAFEVASVAGIEQDSASVAGIVPEPASWALMLVGFGGMGVAVRARRKLVAAA